MDQQVTERRHHARFAPPENGAARATLRPGCLVSLVDVSAGGALVEAPRPLRPGARVHLQVMTASRTFSVEAHVTRCTVWLLDPIDGVRYRGALRFEHRIEWCWGGSTRDGNSVPESAGPRDARAGNAIPAAATAHASGRRKSAG